MPEPRVGTVTFLFTDVEGSTRLVRQLRDRYPAVLEDHRRLVRDAFSRHGGEEVDTQGDAFFYVFSRARDAAAAAAEAQLALQAYAWPEDAELRVRMGMHTGEPSVSEEGYSASGCTEPHESAPQGTVDRYCSRRRLWRCSRTTSCQA